MADHSEPGRLYELADDLYRLAPWNWMREAQLIGLRHPETGELAHLSVMGAAGSHRTVALYLGEAALHRFNLIQQAADQRIDLSREDVVGLILESRQLQASFALRYELFPSELAEIKALGRKYRGSNWPCFRSFHPACAPVPVDRAEAQWLLCGLEQILTVAPQLNTNPFGDYRGGPNGIEILTRERVEGTWQTTWTPADERLFEYPAPAPAAVLAAKVRKHSLAVAMECQFQIFPSPVGAGESAVFPYLVVSVDHASGVIFGIELLSIETQSLEELFASAPDQFLQMWDRHGLRPSSLRVSSEATRAILEKTARALGVRLHREASLPALESALSSMFDFMGQREN